MLHVLQLLQATPFAERYGLLSGSSSVALCAPNVQITLNDVTTWSWVKLLGRA